MRRIVYDSRKSSRFVYNLLLWILFKTQTSSLSHSLIATKTNTQNMPWHLLHWKGRKYLIKNILQFHFTVLHFQRNEQTNDKNDKWKLIVCGTDMCIKIFVFSLPTVICYESNWMPIKLGWLARMSYVLNAHLFAQFHMSIDFVYKTSLYTACVCLTRMAFRNIEIVSHLNWCNICTFFLSTGWKWQQRQIVPFAWTHTEIHGLNSVADPGHIVSRVHGHFNRIGGLSSRAIAAHAFPWNVQSSVWRKLWWQ